MIVRNFSRYHKYTLGSDLRDGARRVLKLVAGANSRRERVPVLFENGAYVPTRTAFGGPL